MNKNLMMKFTSITTLLVIAGCEGVEFTNDSTPTDIAGVEGSSTTLLNIPGGDHALKGITWTEKDNKPCAIKATFVNVVDLDDLTNTVFNEFDNCNFASLSEQVGSVFTPNVSSDVDNDGLVVNEVSVCNSKNENNDRIKGVSMWYSRLTGFREDASQYTCRTSDEEPGGVVSGPCQEEDVFNDIESFPNCDPDGGFSPRRPCPFGQVATGLIAHLNNADEITGLQLECQALSVVQN